MLGLARANMAASTKGGSALSLIILDKFLFYLRYINFNYPDSLKCYFSLDNSSFSLSLSMELKESTQEQFTERRLPKKFAEFGFHSSYMINCWDPFFTFCLVTMFGGILGGASYGLKTQLSQILQGL